MLTADDLRGVALFASLDEAALGEVAHTSADIHLAPGEFAVPEGGERASFAVVAGKMRS
jgi:thioredoxin reductase (NADPH)